MKVLHITPAFAPAYAYGGPISVLRELCFQLARQGHEVRVLTTDSGGLRRSLDVPTQTEVRLEERLRVQYCKRLARHSVSLHLLRSLPAYIQWADVVHLTAVYNFPTLPALLLCRILKKPVLWSPHGVLQRWAGSRRTCLKAVWEGICRALAPKQVILHTTSEDEARESGQRFPGLPVHVIPWGVKTRDLVDRVPQSGRLRLLYLGRLEEKKGIENLIEACAILAASSKLEWSLTVAGTGPSAYARSLATRIRQAGLEARGDVSAKTIQLVGEVSGEDKDWLFAKSDVLVVPSYTENFSVVVGEALAREMPVITSTGTPWERVEPMGCGLYVDNSPRSLADAIESISRLPIPEMGKRGREWVAREFPWPLTALRLGQCYQELVKAQESP